MFQSGLYLFQRVVDFVQVQMKRFDVLLTGFVALISKTSVPLHDTCGITVSSKECPLRQSCCTHLMIALRISCLSTCAAWRSGKNAFLAFHGWAFCKRDSELPMIIQHGYLKEDPLRSIHDPSCCHEVIVWWERSCPLLLTQPGSSLTSIICFNRRNDEHSLDLTPFSRLWLGIAFSPLRCPRCIMHRQLMDIGRPARVLDLHKGRICIQE